MKTSEFIKIVNPASGFINLLCNLLSIAVVVGLDIHWINGGQTTVMTIITIVFVILWILHIIGFTIIQPNKSLVLTFFGPYSGTIKQSGFFWINPFYGRKKLSLRACNMDVEPIKVNDKNGNPIMIGLVLVWKIKDTYKACFEIDAETPPSVSLNDTNTSTTHLKSYDYFVRVQSDAALRKVAGMYAYDHIDKKMDEITLRSGGEEINNRLEEELRERLAIAGIEVVEARINYLAYAAEIASVMLRRQQAEAIISAREKIVEGAVSMVNLAIEKLESENIVKFDDKQKATMVTNLMVVLCADESASPVINTGAIS